MTVDRPDGVSQGVWPVAGREQTTCHMQQYKARMAFLIAMTV